MFHRRCAAKVALSTEHSKTAVKLIQSCMDNASCIWRYPRWWYIQLILSLQEGCHLNSHNGIYCRNTYCYDNYVHVYMYICSSAIVLEKVHTVINFVINLYRGFKLICGSDMTPWSSNRNTRTNTCTFCDTLINKGLMFRFSVRFGFDTFLPIFEINTLTSLLLWQKCMDLLHYAVFIIIRSVQCTIIRVILLYCDYM